MFTETMLCPWNYFSLAWLSRIPEQGKVWRHKRVPYRTESNPYWVDYTKGQPVLAQAIRLTQHWRVHCLECRLDANEPKIFPPKRA
jgi:hypothetical protein